MINNIAASLLAWKNAGSQHLRTHPPAIAADLKAIVTRTAARVIAGLLVFKQSYTTPQTDAIAKTGSLPAPATTLSYAKISEIGLPSPDLQFKVAKKARPTVLKSRVDSRVMVRLELDHFLRHENALLLRMKLRSLLECPELIEDNRWVPSGIVFAAPSLGQALELLLLKI
ncbi:BgTH12-03693 [Blumeria graminis f. sp. triticale]|uniref:BgTH12-03693 n=1 Tax=Blumeria graminis f. sp. triticale TaxID=1689686 RepID=A0A9W4GBK3_BLUGR|nr:BgTH12-03693 [Blumeria graminis f. sp. triticale]